MEGLGCVLSGVGFTVTLHASVATPTATRGRALRGQCRQADCGWRLALSASTALPACQGPGARKVGEGGRLNVAPVEAAVHCSPVAAVAGGTQAARSLPSWSV